MASPRPLTLDPTDPASPAGAVPVSIFGVGGGSSTVAWDDVTGKPATFPPTTGTTAATAKPGNYTPTSTEVGNALKAKTQISALAAVSAANGAPAAADPVTKAEFDVLVTLANANKAAINAIIAALKA